MNMSYELDHFCKRDASHVKNCPTSTSASVTFRSVLNNECGTSQTHSHGDFLPNSEDELQRIITMLWNPSETTSIRKKWAVGGLW